MMIEPLGAVVSEGVGEGDGVGVGVPYKFRPLT